MRNGQLNVFTVRKFWRHYPVVVDRAGVQPIINRAYRSTDNAIVERNHQTWYAHVLDGVAYSSLEAI